MSTREEQFWSSHEFPWYEKLKNVLRFNFGVDHFRPMQLQAINATMRKRDVILIMPKGSGKSLCFQAAALLCPGITLVVSPLISSIDDQLLCLRSFDVPAAKLDASTPDYEALTVHTDIADNNARLKLLYVTPEMILNRRFMAQLEKCFNMNNLKRIVIDDVHCASHFGNDFRPDCRTLGLLKRQFDNVPILGLTSTSTLKVIEDVKKILGIPLSLVIRTPIKRANLYYEFCRKHSSPRIEVMDDTVSTITKYFCRMSGSGIVYCFSCVDCDTMCKVLSIKRISAAVYHAKLSREQKSFVRKRWMDNKIQVICVPVGFLMDIYKPDVRFVIHQCLSKNLESYYEESSQAGRDGLPALCLLYSRFSDVFQQSRRVLTEYMGLDNFYRMVDYCWNSKDCRREQMSSHVVISSSSCNKACDVCSESVEFDVVDVSVQCKQLMKIVRAASPSKSFTGKELVKAALGYEEFESNSILQSVSKDHIQRVIMFMILQGYLKEDFHFTPRKISSYVKPGPKARMDIDKVTLPFLNSRNSSGYEDFLEFWKSNHPNAN